jgi:uncharacterized membrane protein YhaH (DUF805 family)
MVGRETYLSKFPVRSGQGRPTQMMRPSSAIEICAQEKYFEFSGRASRSEFGFFFLFSTLFATVINSILYYIGDLFGAWVATIANALSLIATLLFIIPLLAVSTRRLHDVGKSGWYILIGIIPLLGWYLLFKAYINEGEDSLNAYGKLPINDV